MGAGRSTVPGGAGPELAAAGGRGGVAAPSLPGKGRRLRWVMEDREPWVVQELRGAGGRPGSSHPEVARGVSWAKYKNRTADTSTLETRGELQDLVFAWGGFFFQSRVPCSGLVGI